MFIETITLISVIFYSTNTNLLVLLYTAGMYLVFLGILLFLNDVDIYVGFLWVIDLGVGLVFFIFILHFTAFLHQKSYFNLNYRYYTIIMNLILIVTILFYFLPFNSSSDIYKDLTGTWFFRVTYLDYYNIHNSFEVTELNLLRDSYFILNSFEFFIVNFSLLFGLLASILMCFTLHRTFNCLNYSQIVDINILNSIDTSFFIKSQNFITQQNTPGVVKVWVKSKSTYLS